MAGGGGAESAGATKAETRDRGLLRVKGPAGAAGHPGGSG